MWSHAYVHVVDWTPQNKRTSLVPDFLDLQEEDSLYSGDVSKF